MMDGKLQTLWKTFRQEIDVYRLILKDRRTPWLARAFLGAAVFYTLLPFDIIPDFIPVIGHLDDIVIVSTLIFVGMKFVPREVIEDCRKMVKGKGEGEREHL